MSQATSFLHGEYWEKLKGRHPLSISRSKSEAPAADCAGGAESARQARGKPHVEVHTSRSESHMGTADCTATASNATTTQVTVVSVGERGRKAVLYAGCSVARSTCHQSHTLLELLETEGSATLPIPPSHFRAWLAFAAAPAAATPSIDGADSLASNAKIVEVSQFMRHAAAEERAASRIAVVLRRAHRRDLMHDHIDANAEEVIFPPTAPRSPGNRLRAAIASLPDLQPPAVAAVARHLTLCEALLLPPPFPAEALAHFFSTTAGVLDLSPPRVPAHNPAALQTISRSLGPLLAAGPPLQALYIPAPCLTSLQPLEFIVPHFSTLTRLCITHGNVTYTGAACPSPLPAATCGTIEAILEVLSPARLRHLSIDAVLDPNAKPMHRLLRSFTALTSLRLNALPRALRHMPSLTSLFLTHLPASSPAKDVEARWLSDAATPLQRIHVSGAAPAVLSVYQRVAAQCTSPPARARTRTIPPITTFMGRMDPDTADDVYGSIDSSGEDVLCCGYPFPGCGASLLRDRVARAGVASSHVHFFRYRFVSGAWGPAVHGLPPPQQGLLSGGGPAGLRTLTLATHALSAETLTLMRRILAGEVPHQLRVLCVLRVPELPPRSAFCACQVLPHRGLGLSGPWPGRRVWGTMCDCGYGWVTARPSGVAHPLCALEMLHYNAAPQEDPVAPFEAPAGDSGSRLCNAGPRASGPGLHTLRLSEHAFLSIQDLVLADAPCMSTLRDLAVLRGGSPQQPPGMPLDLSCLSRLTHLRTLSLQGVPRVCSAPRLLRLSPSLTALLLHGFDTISKPAAAAAFGPQLLRLPELQCLDVDVVVSRTMRSPGGPDAGAAMRRGLWEGLRPALQELPLRLGARVRFREAPTGAEADVEFPALG